MILKYYVEIDGELIVVDNVHIWSALYEEINRRVASDEIGEVRVSTVFIGLDHNFGDGPPLIYETMIFGGFHGDYCERYSTREEAEKGHKEAVLLVKGSLEKKNA